MKVATLTETVNEFFKGGIIKKVYQDINLLINYLLRFKETHLMNLLIRGYL